MNSGCWKGKWNVYIKELREQIIQGAWKVTNKFQLDWKKSREEAELVYKKKN